jgi:hypothetical protein
MAATPTTTTEQTTREINDSDDIFHAVESKIDEILNAADTDAAREQVTAYLDQAAALGVNRYSLRNQIGLIRQLNARDAEYKNNAAHWAGFNGWLDQGRHVKKGENGYKVLAPVTGPACPDCGNAPNYHAGNDSLDCPRAGEDPDEWDFDPADTWSEGVLYFRTATTFAIQQTSPNDDADPEDVFTPMEDDCDTNTDGVNTSALYDDLAAAAEAGRIDNVAPCTIEKTGSASALGLGTKGGSAGGLVLVKQGRTTAKQFQTLAHEIAHERLHQDTRDDVPEHCKEVEAEAVAYAVASYFGLDPDSSEMYIAAWVEHARKTGELNSKDADRDAARAAIRDRLNTVQDTAALIIDAIENNEQ